MRRLCRYNPRWRTPAEALEDVLRWATSQPLRRLLEPDIITPNHGSILKLALILHCGAGKCGSSALQTALTETPSIADKNGRRIAYGHLHPVRNLTTGHDVKKFISSRGYTASFLPADHFPRLNAVRIDEQIRNSGADDIILSLESWFHQSEMWVPLLQELEVPVHVVAYVRPQVPWLNSAWWQWGAWSNQPFERWILRKLETVAMWGKFAQQWHTAPNVEQMSIRLLQGDIVEDFFTSVINAEPPTTSGQKINQSLPETVLRLFQKNRELRQGPHDSVIENLLGRYLNMPGKPPWVIPPELIDRILDITRQSNLDLLPHLHPEQAEIIRNDSRWWSPEAYEGLSASDPRSGELASDELEKLCVGLIKALRQSALG